MFASNSNTLVPRPEAGALALGIALAVCVQYLAAGHAWAGEVVPEIGTQIGWDSNNDGETVGEKGTVRSRTIPAITIREQVGRVGFQASGSIAYDAALDFGDPDDYFDQFGDASIDWQITPRTTTSLYSRFARVENVDRALALDGFAIEEIPDTDAKQTRSLHNRSTWRLRHRIASRWLGTMRADYYLSDYKDDQRFDNNGFSASTGLGYTLNARTVLGFGTSAAYNSYDPSSFERGARSKYIQGFASVDYLWAPDLRMSASAGPAWVERDTKPGAIEARRYPFITSFNGIQPSDFGVDPEEPYGFLLRPCDNVEGFATAPSYCPPASLVPVLMTTANNPIESQDFRFAGESSDTSGVDLFANAALVKSWEWGDVTLTYNRRETTDGGQSTGTTADSVSLFTSGYRPSPLWNVTGLINWTQRESAGDSPLDLAAVQTTTVSVDADGNFVPVGTGIDIPGVAIANLNGYVTDGTIDNATDVWTILMTFEVERRWSKNLVLFGNWSWRHDERSGDGRSDTTLDVFRIFVGARYVFDPILF